MFGHHKLNFIPPGQPLKMNLEQPEPHPTQISDLQAFLLNVLEDGMGHIAY